MSDYNFSDEEKKFLKNHPGCGMIIFIISLIIVGLVFFGKMQ